MTHYQLKKLPAILSIVLPLIGFLLILGSLNLYQYFKIKNNIAAARLAKIGKIELVELQSFFKDMSNRLIMAREWGKNGIIQPSSTVIDLNKKFFPFMTNQDKFTGLLLADSTGTEYYLYRSATGLITRRSEVKKDTTRQTWQEWIKPDREVRQWEEKSDYDPRKRPWFISPHKENKVSWTNKYTFFQSGKSGLTASVSWIDPDSPNKYMVFGIDLLIEDIQILLSLQQQKRGGIVFLTNIDAGYSIDSSSPAAENLTEQGTLSPHKVIIKLAIDAWNEAGRPDEQSITFTHGKQKWLAQFNQLNGENNQIWIGVAGSEKEMTAELIDILFEVDITDFAAATAGGVLMLFLVWRFSWRRAGYTESHKIDAVTLQEIIGTGEGAHLEFKASVRYNFKAGKMGKEIEFSWLKAVVAFLNSGGGTLLIGVTDDGKPSGIGHDDFDNDDRCLLHVKNLLNQYIGAEFSRLLNVHLIEYDGYRVVAVECGHSREPVFLKVGKNEDFFIRSGPSSTKLSPSQIISYLKKNHS